MQFTCDKTEFLSATGTVIRAVPGRSALPVLEGVLLETGDGSVTLTGYDLKMAIRTGITAEVMRGGSAVLNAKLLLDILRRMPDGDVTVDCGEQLTTVLQCGDTHYSVTAMPAEDYPELPEVAGGFVLEIQESVLKSMIEDTVFAVSTDESRMIHTGELMELKNGKLNMVACDGFRLAMRTEDVESAADRSLVIPGAVISEVEKLCGNTDERVRVFASEKHVQFLVGRVELIARRLEGSFIDYGKVIPTDGPIRLTVDAKSMMSSIDRVMVVVSEKMKSALRLQAGFGEITMSAKTAAGSVRDKCAAEGDGTGLEIGFNGRYLYEAIRHISESAVRLELKTAAAPCVIRGSSGDGRVLHMVLPVRLTAG